MSKVKVEDCALYQRDSDACCHRPEGCGAFLKKVKAAEDMDTETFLKHINARHTPIGGMTVVGRSNIPGDYDEALLREYHRRTHELGLDAIGHGKSREVNHTHGERHG